ncbi:hypothetical protein LTR15_006269 [Elasticomyces elasticus]|nr:hypothetical protein LTR15_006269 [Elasticomyces elasticus]
MSSDCVSERYLQYKLDCAGHSVTNVGIAWRCDMMINGTHADAVDTTVIDPMCQRASCFLSNSTLTSGAWWLRIQTKRPTRQVQDRRTYTGNLCFPDDCVIITYGSYNSSSTFNATSEQCVYEDQVSQPRPSYQFVAETPGAPVGSRRRPQNTLEEPDDVTIPAARLHTIEARMAALSNMVRVLQTQTSSGAASSAAHSTPDSSILYTTNEPGLPYDPSGHLSHQENGHIRYVEPTFWASLGQDVSDLDDILSAHTRCLERSENDIPLDNGSEPGFEGQPSYHSEPRVPSEYACPSSASSIPLSTSSHASSTGDNLLQTPGWRPEEPLVTRTVARYPEFLRQLPSKRRCDALLNGYVSGYHPMVPIIHVPRFRKQYEEFWEARYDIDAEQTASMSFAALLVAIMYAGSVACPDAVSSGAVGAPAPGEAANHLHKLTMKALHLSNFPHTPTLDSFRAYIICQSTWARAEEPLTCVAFVGLALRVATILGLYKDPSHFAGMDLVECEVRRRVWWHLVHIDVLVAISSGLPPMVEAGCWDVRAISELKEEHFGTYADPRDPANASLVSTIGVLVAGKLRATMVLRRTIARLSAPDPLTSSHLVAMRSEFRLLGEDLASRISRIPEPHLNNARTTAAIETYENNFALNRWARLLLSAYVDEQYSIACRPILNAPISDMWPELYPRAIEHCQSFLNKCAQMASISEFRNFQWSWPGIHQPLHAIMLLLIDLVQSSDTDTASASRRSVDICFALFGPHGGIVGGGTGSDKLMERPLTEGGQEAWEYFRRLRTQAWQKAGIDPAVVWTREQAVQYCNKQAEPPVIIDQVGPMWSEGSASDREGLDTTNTQHPAQTFEAGMTSPPSIDWTYLDAVLKGHQQPDLGFGYGQ